MSRQDQSVSEGGQAIQALGNVNINQGLSAEQMITIMEGVERQVQRGIGQAEQLVQARLDEFKQSVLEEFAKPDSTGDAEAFADPDFQHALHEAQKGFVRSGELGLKDELVKLLAQRSTEPGRTRTALILNEAIQTIGSLTSQEISALSISFVFCHLQIVSAPGLAQLFAEYRRWLAEFSQDYPENNFSYEYLHSMRCMTVNSISHSDIWNILTHRYENVFTTGFMQSDLPTTLPPTAEEELFERIPAAPDGRMRFKAQNRSDVVTAMTAVMLDPQLQSELLSLYDRTKLSVDDFKAQFLAGVPELAEVVRRWDSTVAKSSNLTGLGKAIAHSALASRTEFRAPLSIWVN